MQNLRKGISSFSKKNTHFISRRVLTQIPANSQRLRQKNNATEMISLRSSASCPSRDILLYSRKMNCCQPKRALSVHAVDQMIFKNEVPAKASEINDIINKKNHVLKIKHKVKDFTDPIPNILEIRQSIKNGEISFMRRMDKQLNTNGNAFLLTRMKQDLHIQCHNYLKQTSEKARKNRKYLIDNHKNQKQDSFIVLQYQLDKGSTARV